MCNYFRKISAVIAAVLIFSGVVFSQDNSSPQKQENTSGINQQLETSAQQLTENLASRVTLRDEQKAEIQDAIFQYQAAIVGVTAATLEDKDKEMPGSAGTTGNETSGNDKKDTQTGIDNPSGSSPAGTETDKTEKAGVEKSAKEGVLNPGSMTTVQMEDWLNNRISNILETGQKPQWEVAKADFWNQLRERVITLQKNSSGTGMY